MERPKEIALSYIMTTFNKLDFLKITLPYLIEACGEDEEIVIIDGGSNDGTAEYLRTLYEQKKIHVFISEKDHGEAHGTNKAILLARGEFIKIITDDDIFDFRVIQHCRRFMSEHPETDILGFDGYGCHIGQSFRFDLSNFIKGFNEWRQNRTPFLFCGLSFLIRRSSLSYLGLFNPAFKIIDMEYSIRVSALASKIAFYEGPGFVNIVNPSSNSQKFYSAIVKEKRLLAKVYPSITNSFNQDHFVPFIREQLGLLLKRKPASLPNKETVMELYKKIVEQALHELEKNNLAGIKTEG